ncbi:hypothetical protein [Methanocella sp. MCL-LM]|uniref:hypothetical protein n=1 Tax=Methanocella sp. MCL-LM TaxID=3412035 RepID=UPI003C72428B
MGKLVRDRIPEIMRLQGKDPEVERISGERLRRALKDKLVEEAEEVRQTDDLVEELADVLEVVDALIDAYGLDHGEIEHVRADKKAKRGGFSSGEYLVG